MRHTRYSFRVIIGGEDSTRTFTHSTDAVAFADGIEWLSRKEGIRFGQVIEIVEMRTVTINSTVIENVETSRDYHTTI